MTLSSEWEIPTVLQPLPEEYHFDLDRALSSVVGLHVIIPNDAFTAETLGTERTGNGVLIEDGLILTVAYLITEAETIWVHLGHGRVVQGHVLGIDPQSGFGLVQALTRMDLPTLRIGSSSAMQVGERLVIGGVGGRTRSLVGQIVAKHEFTGYWEYLLEDAFFTFPAHPNWGGTALISTKGELIGVGSLSLERAQREKKEYLNMSVPIDLLASVIDDLRKYGRVNKPVRPWLGIYSTEVDNKVVIIGVAPRGPAARAELKTGDIIVAIAGEEVSSLAALYRKIWSLGFAGVEVPLTLSRDDVTFHVRVNSSDRAKFLKAPRIH